MKRTKVNVAGVDRGLPRTFGDTWVHVSEIDYFYECHETPQVRMRPEPSPTAMAIAEHVSGLVRNGDTLEIGAGSTSGALASLGVFDDKEDLGFFSELASPGIIDLVKRGIITSKYATVRPNRFVTTGLLGGAEDYAYVDNNPFFEFYDYDYMLNPAVIGQNDHMVAINNALSIDLRGQIALVSIGPRIFAGSGGQLSYHLGAYLSKGGRAITVLPSTTSDGKISRIVHQHPQGQMVTIPWDLADTVVTEYGVADLVGKSIRQRAQELIAIAHPDFRPDLQKAVSQLLQ
jgi:4-hydroxybutyrate CoA-transferase